MKIMKWGAVSALAIVLTACGGSDEPEVVEQVVVRDPGQVAAKVVATPGDQVAAGKAAFAMCGACHVAEPGAPSAAGPNLYGVEGRQAGSLDDFSYSEALAAADFTWDAARLDQFLADPAGTVPGTYMVAQAVRDDERRAAIIAYLESLGE